MNKKDKIISLILLTIANALTRYDSKYYNHEISKIKEEILKGED